jgi:hypothetical protein
MTRILASTLLLALCFGGCVEKSKSLTAAERQELAEHVSQTATSPSHPLDISFENKVELIGYDVTAESWAPGATITVTWHWKVLRALEDGWLQFTHVADGGNNRLNEDGNGVVRRLYPAGQWKAGEYVRDSQEITLPEDWSGREATFYLGFWNGPHRLRVVRGPADEDNRARALALPTRAGGGGEVRPEPSVPSLEARRAEAITLDGRLDEPAWARTPSTGAFVDTMSGARASFGAQAKVLWDDENLYVGFEVEDDYLKSSFRNRDDHLWEQDCVEIMVDPDGDGRNYFELQVSPRNVAFDTRYDSRRVPQPIGHADWNAELRSAVHLRGTVDDDDEDQGYSVEIAIPWSSFATGTPPATKPSAGQAWRINFYVMDSREEGQRANGWSPPRVGDFHVPDRFGRVTFVAPTAQVAPTAPSEQPVLVAPTAPTGNTAVPVVRTLRPELADSVRQALPNLRGRGTAVEDEMARREQNQRQGDEPVVGAPE